MVVDLGTNFDYHTSQVAVDLLTDEEINQNNLPDNNKVKPCKSYNFDNQALPFDSPSSLFILHLNISSLQAHFDELSEGCEDLWMSIDFPGLKSKYVFDAIYFHPCSNHNAFFDNLEQNMQALNDKKTKVMIMSDINIDLASQTNYVSDYNLLLQSDFFFSLITKST